MIKKIGMMSISIAIVLMIGLLMGNAIIQESGMTSTLRWLSGYAFQYELKGQNDETFDNYTDGYWDVGAGIYKGSGGIDLTGDYTMENDEIMSNPTDGDWKITFNDDNAIKGQVFISSSIDSPNVADNDLFEVIFEANDDSSGLTNWVTLQAKILDASDESEDSHFTIETWTAGTEAANFQLIGNDVWLLDDLNLDSDSAVLKFGADQDVTLTHVADSGLLLNAGMYLTFRDNALKIVSSVDGQLDIEADTEVEITTTLVDLNGAADISDSLKIGGGQYLTKFGMTATAGSLFVIVSNTVQATLDTAWLPLN